MKTSKCLLAASVALFAGNCDMVEGSALPVDGQQQQLGQHLEQTFEQAQIWTETVT